MTFIDILIPLIIGILLAAAPQLFTKSAGEARDRVKAKLRRIGVVLIGVAAIYTVVKVGEALSSRGTASKPQMEMHRLQAATPGGSGWYLAESTHGSFSVLTPIPFNDFTVTETDPKWGTTQLHTVGARSAEGLKFSATETPIVPGRSAKDLDEMQHRLSEEGSELSDVTKAVFSGWPSLSLCKLGPNSGAFIRCVQTDSSHFIVILEFPIARRSEAAQLKSRFLDSLRIEAPNKSAPGHAGQ